MTSARTTALSLPTVEALEGAGLDPSEVEGVVRSALDEDRGGGVDVTSESTVPADRTDTGDLVARAPGVVAGLPVGLAVLDLAGGGRITASLLAADGDRVERGDVLLTASGPTRALLTAERIVLNLTCHLSGVATATRRWADALEGTGAAVRDTRKTIPGLRVLEKYAVRCGGGVNHRIRLSDQALVKDNHIVVAGGVRAAYEAVRRQYPDLPVEVECATVEQVREAVDAGVELILLDNMDLDTTRAAVAVARPAGARLESSGTLRLEDARALAEAGVDYLSVGAITHSAPVLDLAFDLRETA